MKDIRVGDYVLFEYNDTTMTGLIREVLNDGERYRIVPNAIGMDYYPIIDGNKVEKA